MQTDDQKSDIAFRRAAARAMEKSRKIPANNQCPICSTFLEKLSQWHNIEGHYFCISCADALRAAYKASGHNTFQEYLSVTEDESQFMADLSQIFSDTRLEYYLPLGNLQKFREKYGISRRRFAELCGWTVQYVFQLENSEKWLSTEASGKIYHALKALKPS